MRVILIDHDHPQLLKEVIAYINTKKIQKMFKIFKSEKSFKKMTSCQAEK